MYSSCILFWWNSSPLISTRVHNHAGGHREMHTFEVRWNWVEIPAPLCTNFLSTLHNFFVLWIPCLFNENTTMSSSHGCYEDWLLVSQMPGTQHVLKGCWFPCFSQKESQRSSPFSFYNWESASPQKVKKKCSKSHFCTLPTAVFLLLACLTSVKKKKWNKKDSFPLFNIGKPPRDF